MNVDDFAAGRAPPDPVGARTHHEPNSWSVGDRQLDLALASSPSDLKKSVCDLWQFSSLPGSSCSDGRVHCLYRQYLDGEA